VRLVLEDALPVGRGSLALLMRALDQALQIIDVKEVDIFKAARNRCETAAMQREMIEAHETRHLRQAPHGCELVAGAG
jgi:hypothetical protein